MNENQQQSQQFSQPDLSGEPDRVPLMLPLGQPIPQPQYVVAAPERRRGGLGFFLGLICGILVCMSIAFIAAVTWRMGLLRFPGPAGEALVNNETRQKLLLIQDSIDRNFYKTDVEEDALRTGLYKGLVSALEDPYSVYYTEDDFNELMSDIEGVYEGIGAYLTLAGDFSYPVITGTIPGSPAEEAGLVADDLITAVEGETTRGLDLSTIVMRVKGKHGTTVNLTIQRESETFDVAIVRDRIESPTVRVEDPVDGIGYLQITEFDDVTPDQFTEGLAQLEAGGMKGLILDLRSNTGGNLDAVCDIARRLLPAGVIVYTLDREGNRVDYNCDGRHEVDYPIVVLTNGYTASASEILAGAIRDHGKGKLLGTTTYGKGVVQRIYRLGDGSALKLTVETYYTPTGYDLNGIGLEPDEVLEFDSDAYREDQTDNQRLRAEELLRNMMK